MRLTQAGNRMFERAECNMQSSATRDRRCRPVNPLIYSDRSTTRSADFTIFPSVGRSVGRRTWSKTNRQGPRGERRQTHGAVACRRLRVHLVRGAVGSSSNEFSWCLVCRRSSCMRHSGRLGRCPVLRVVADRNKDARPPNIYCRCDVAWQQFVLICAR